MSSHQWIKLGGKKEPPQGEAIIVWIPKEDVPNKGYQDKGRLIRIEFNHDKREYVFDCRGEEVVASHYMIIEKPKE